MKSFVQNQMVNTRRGSDQQGKNNQGQNNQGTGIPMCRGAANHSRVAEGTRLSPEGVYSGVS